MPNYIYSYPSALRNVDDGLPDFHRNPALTLSQTQEDATNHLAQSIDCLRILAVPDAYIPRFLRSVYFTISIDFKEKIWNSMKDDSSKFEDGLPNSHVFSYHFRSESLLLR